MSVCALRSCSCMCVGPRNRTQVQMLSLTHYYFFFLGCLLLPCTCITALCFGRCVSCCCAVEAVPHYIIFATPTNGDSVCMAVFACVFACMHLCMCSCHQEQQIRCKMVIQNLLQLHAMLTFSPTPKFESRYLAGLHSRCCYNNHIWCCLPSSRPGDWFFECVGSVVAKISVAPQFYCLRRGISGVNSRRRS